MGNNVGRPEGGNVQAKVSIENHKAFKINPEHTPLSVRYKPMPADTKKFRCCMCGNEWTTQKGNFLSGGKSPLWKANGGYLPFCKTCCESLMENMISFYGGNEEHALRHLCQVFDWYYDEAASAMTLAQVHKGNSRVNIYPSKMCTRQVATRGETYLDTVRDDFEAAKIVKSATDVVVEDFDEEPFVVTREIIRRWSTGMAPEEYEFLENEYEDWNNKVEVKTKSQEELIKAICLAQLNVRRAQAAGNSKAVTESMKALTDLMANCNLTPRQASEIANSSSTQMCLGQLIKRIEDEEPIKEASDEFKDPDGIRKYLSTFFFGHLAKALHIKNDNQRAYDEEMAKYTVEPPDESEGSESITDLFSDSQNDGDEDEGS
jgi:hypothetical protein